MPSSMGIGPVLGNKDIELKLTNRWMLSIDKYVGYQVNMLPPLSGGRPSLSFKEVELEHISETIFRPTKATWRPIKVKVYDYRTNLNDNLIFNWIKKFYDSELTGDKSYSYSKDFVQRATIALYNGSGCVIESWYLENAWPKDIEWGELTMQTSSVVTIDFELRYDRAYITKEVFDTGACSR